MYMLTVAYSRCSYGCTRHSRTEAVAAYEMMWQCVVLSFYFSMSSITVIGVTDESYSRLPLMGRRSGAGCRHRRIRFHLYKKWLGRKVLKNFMTRQHIFFSHNLEQRPAAFSVILYTPRKTHSEKHSGHNLHAVSWDSARARYFIHPPPTRVGQYSR